MHGSFFRVFGASLFENQKRGNQKNLGVVESMKIFLIIVLVVAIIAALLLLSCYAAALIELAMEVGEEIEK